MKILVTCSWVTAVCALLTALWSVPQALATGTLTVSAHPLFHVLFLFPGQIGVPVCLLAAFHAAVLVARRELDALPECVLAGGQLLTVVMLALCALVLSIPAAMGREFIVMAVAFQAGQIIVAVGLALRVRRLRAGRWFGAGRRLRSGRFRKERRAVRGAG